MENIDIDAIIEQCALDRVWFAENILGFKPDPWQKQLFNDLDAGETRISIRSGHGVGKTASSAINAIHFILFRPGSTNIIITSPSRSQLFDGLWAEILLWIDKLPAFLKDQLDIKGSGRVVRKDNPENAFISLRTARIENPEALAGIHADNVLILIDEASGVPEPIYEAAAGTLSTVGSIAVLIGNPTRTSGYFHRTHTILADYWKTYRVSCLDSPRVSTAFVEDIRRSYGEDSAQWKIRILGEFADLNNDVIIPRDLCESALGRDVQGLEDDEEVWGIDPGRGGDPTGFVRRKGGNVYYATQYHLSDLMAVVGRVYEQWLDAKEPPAKIFVDTIGLGAGVADRLRELGLPVIDVNVSESPALKERYPRLRDEIWFEGRKFFETRRVRIVDNDYGRQLVEELCAPLVQISTTGKSQAESKKDMKSRGVPSPNMADALNLTFALGGAVMGGRGTGGSSWGKPLSRGLGGVA